VLALHSWRTHSTTIALRWSLPGLTLDVLDPEDVGESPGEPRGGRDQVEQRAEAQAAREPVATAPWPLGLQVREAEAVEQGGV
jgi:hypothetical protein